MARLSKYFRGGCKTEPINVILIIDYLIFDKSNITNRFVPFFLVVRNNY